MLWLCQLFRTTDSFRVNSIFSQNKQLKSTPEMTFIWKIIHQKNHFVNYLLDFHGSFHNYVSRYLEYWQFWWPDFSRFSTKKKEKKIFIQLDCFNSKRSLFHNIVYLMINSERIVNCEQDVDDDDFFVTINRRRKRLFKTFIMNQS